MISGIRKINLGNVDCSLYPRPFALKDEYHGKPMDMLAQTPVEFNYLETFEKTFIIHARQSQFFRGNIFNNAPVCRIAVGMNANSAFTWSYTKIPVWYQRIDLRETRKHRRGQQIVKFDAVDNCRLYSKTKKVMNFQGDILSIPNDIFKDHNVLEFDLTPMQDATENCH